MRGSLFGLAYVLSLPLFANAQLDVPATEGSSAKDVGRPVKGPGRKGISSGTAAQSTTSSRITLTASLASSLSSTSATSSGPATFFTTTNTIEVSSFMTSPSNVYSSSNPSSSAVAAATGYSAMDSSTSPTSSASSSSSHGSDSHRTLIIVLSTVLGFVGLLLIAVALFLACRIGQLRFPFGQRSATPLDDDEIDSWRGTVIEQKQQPAAADPAMLNRRANSIQLQASPGWTWTASPTSLRSALSPATAPQTPAFLAKAPNSRVGLTDETVPGADPFIPPIKRQSSRLSKAPPGHGRSKSRRSSMSAKSVWSYNGGIGPNSASRGSTNDKMPMWFDPEDHTIRMELSRTDRTMSDSPAMSMYDGVIGGLSPRPQPQARPWDKEIGRAIA